MSFTITLLVTISTKNSQKKMYFQKPGRKSEKTWKKFRKPGKKFLKILWPP